MANFDPRILRGYAAHMDAEASEARGVTPRRLSAAKRWLKKERENAPLIADQIAELQPTAEERIAAHDAEWLAKQEYWRDTANKKWTAIVAEVAAMNTEDRDQFVAEWNTSPSPDDWGYIASHLRSFQAGERRSKIARPDIADPVVRAQAEKLEKQLATLRDIEGRATAESGKSYARKRIAEVAAELDRITGYMAEATTNEHCSAEPTTA